MDLVVKNMAKSWQQGIDRVAKFAADASKLEKDIADYWRQVSEQECEDAYLLSEYRVTDSTKPVQGNVLVGYPEGRWIMMPVGDLPEGATFNIGTGDWTFDPKGKGCRHVAFEIVLGFWCDTCEGGADLNGPPTKTSSAWVSITVTDDKCELPGNPCTSPEARAKAEQCLKKCGGGSQTIQCGSSDPNDISGPAGVGYLNWVSSSGGFDYMIRFENDAETATAPAAVVRVTEQLDSDLDWATFRLGVLGFGDTVLDDAFGKTSYETRLNLLEQFGVYLDISAGIDLTNGQVFWELKSVDPETGEVPFDPLFGFLPPNADGSEGQGFVTYSVSPKAAAVSGTRIDAVATIIFDQNEPIDTPPIFNTLDGGGAHSAVLPLPNATAEREFGVAWSGTDDPDGSGIDSYDLFVSTDGGEYTPWLSATSATQATFTGEYGHTYAFYSIARDLVGHIEAPPDVPDAVTTTPAGIAVIGDRIWLDADADGVQDVGESGLPGVTVTLFDASDIRVAQTTTDEAGYYRFDDLTTESEYYVAFTAPEGYRFSSQDQGSDDANDSDVDPTTGRTDMFGVNTGEHLDWDAGLYRPVEIRGTLWQDANGDSLQDDDELVLAGWTVFLDLNVNGSLDDGEPATVTNEDGSYRFRDLMPGEYVVGQVMPNRWDQTYPGLDGANDEPQGQLPLQFNAAVLVQAAGADVQAMEYSVPVLVDWNNDGLDDLLVGEKVGDYGRIRLYLNERTDSEPEFNTVSLIQAGGADLMVPATGCLGVFPRVVDWNVDGRKDLLLGLANGKVQVLLNLNTDALPMFDAGVYVQAGAVGEKVDIDVGARATADVVDWNADGRPDLVVGALDGRVRVYLNEGTPPLPDLRSEWTVQDASGDLTVPSGRASVAVTDLDGDGRLDLVLGNTDGQLYFYRNIGTRSVPRFETGQRLQANGVDIDLGTTRSRPFVSDFNADGLTDLLVGGADGFVRLFTRQAAPALSTEYGSEGHLAPQLLAESSSQSFAHTLHLVSGEVRGDVNFGNQFVNSPPVAVNDAYTVNENETLVIPALGVLGNDHDTDGDRVTAALVGGPLHGTVSLAADGSFTYIPQDDFLGDDRFTYSVSDGWATSSVATVTITSTIDTRPLRVSRLGVVPSGFVAHLSRAVDSGVLNLYDTQAGGWGPADFTVVGAQVGPVAGSLVYDAQKHVASFVKTGGPLMPDTYTITLRSADSGFRDMEGNLLDGNGDTVPGDDYTTTVVVAPWSGRLVSVPDFARGPSQGVNVPATGVGLPIRLDNGDGILGISFAVDYDPTLLSVTAVTASSTLPETWNVEYQLDAPGRVAVLMYGTEPLAAGPVSLVNLQAAVPADAPYRSAGVLNLSNVEINDGAIAAAVDAGVQVVAYLGDATGNGRYGGLDAAYLARTALGRDQGFAAYPLKDPVIVGDTSANGRLGALDASYLARKVVGRTQPEIPDLPSDLPAPVANGPDPIVRMPTIANARRGDTIVRPITSDDAAGLLAYELWIDYDTSVLDLADGDVQLPAGLTGWSYDRVVNDAAGTVHVIAYTSGDPLPTGQVNLLDVTYHVRSDAPAGTSALDLEGELNEGGLVITPVDGSIAVVINQPPTDVTLVPSSVAENQPTGTVVGAFVTTDPDDTDFTYELIPGDGDTDNSSFAIANGQLTTAATFNFESKSSYTVRVQATDTADQSVERALTINVVDVDEIAPTVTIKQAAGQADPPNAGPIHFTVVFSEPVTGFSATDVLLGGTAPGTLSAAVTPVDTTTYDVAVSGMTGSGTVTAAIAAGAATDGAGNESQASTSTDNAVHYSAEASSSISGFVYVDVRNNGVKDPTDTGLPNVPVTISGPVTRTVFTGPDGDYHFDNLPAGTYTVTETQPLAFRDGQDTIGTPAAGRAENDRFVDVEITTPVDLVNYNFGERGLRADLIGLELLYASTPSTGQLLQQLDIVGDEGWFRLPTPDAGILTAALPHGSPQAIELYTEDWMPVALGAGPWLLNARVQAGHTYVLHVIGAPSGEASTAMLALTTDTGIPFAPHENGQYTNPIERCDVSGDGRVSPIDALLTINELNQRGARLLLGPHQDPPYFDVSDDEYVTALDVLQLVNRLNALSDGLAEQWPASPPAEGEGPANSLVPMQPVVPFRGPPSAADHAESPGLTRPVPVAAHGVIPTEDALADILTALVPNDKLTPREHRPSVRDLPECWDIDFLDLDLDPLLMTPDAT